jgi:hypothetical protein
MIANPHSDLDITSSEPCRDNNTQAPSLAANDAEPIPATAETTIIEADPAPAEQFEPELGTWGFSSSKKDKKRSKRKSLAYCYEEEPDAAASGLGNIRKQRNPSHGTISRPGSTLDTCLIFSLGGTLNRVRIILRSSSATPDSTPLRRNMILVPYRRFLFTSSTEVWPSSLYTAIG